MSFLLTVLSFLILSAILFFSSKSDVKPKIGLNLLASFFASLILSVLSLLLSQGNIIQPNQLNLALNADLFLAAQLIYLFVVNLAGLAIYLYLNQRFPDNRLQKYSLTLSNILLGLCIAFLFFFYKRSFTLTSFISLLVILLYIEYRSNLRYMYRAYRAFAALLLPFLLMNWLLASQFLFIRVSDEGSTGIRILSTPVELIALLFCSLLICINFVERIQNRNAKR